MYEQTMTALREIRTFAAHATNLGKIAARTEDERLRELLGGLVSALRAASVVSKRKNVRSTAGNLVDASALLPPVAPLTMYCQSVIETKKPEWQILAERHGWTPPTKS
jgi:hypothetical protein